MRLLLGLLVASCCPIFAQTLKWTHQVPDPPFVYNSSGVTEPLSDALGNSVYVAYFFRVVDGVQVESGSQIGWLSPAGKLIHLSFAAGTVLTYGPPIYVSGNALLVQFERQNGSKAVRKFTRTAGIVNFTDMETGEDEPVPNASTASRSSFFTRSQSGAPTIKRFSVR